MILKNIKLFLKLYYRPLNAMSGIIDEGSWFFGAIAVLAVSLLLNFTIAERIYNSYEAVPTTKTYSVAQQPMGQDFNEDYEDTPRTVTRQVIVRQPLPVVGNVGYYFTSFSIIAILGSILTLALLYVPATILAIILFESLGSFGVVIRRDYGPVLACTLMAWAAAHLPISLAALLITPARLGGPLALILLLAGKLFFGILMMCALRVIFSARVISAIGAISISWVAMALQSILFWFTSPFILLWLYSYLRGDIGTDILSSYSRRQSFRRNLEASTINPLDAEAHYQLGLIYHYRRQYSEAITRFKRAVEIDKREIDAHFQLGLIAREQGRLQDALGHFEPVITLDDKHSRNEVWREVGATYEAAGMYEDARHALERYIERRSYDAEGLYYFGKTLSKLGQREQAKEMLERCIEAVKTAPYYHRKQLRKWSKLAEEQLRASQTQGAPV